MVGVCLRIIIRKELSQAGQLIGEDKFYSVVVFTRAFIVVFFFSGARPYRGA